MSNTLPTIEPCPPPGTRDPICLAEAKAIWDKGNENAEAVRDAALVVAAGIYSADLARLDNLVRPAHMTNLRWARRKLRISIGIEAMNKFRIQTAEDQLKLEYLDANEAYVKAAEECACLGEAYQGKGLPSIAAVEAQSPLVPPGGNPSECSP